MSLRKVRLITTYRILSERSRSLNKFVPKITTTTSSSFSTNISSSATSATSRATDEKWQLAVAVCLERFPIVAPPMSDLQRSFNDVLLQIEHETSLLSEHELRDVADKKRTARLAKKKEAPDTSVEDSTTEDVGTVTAKDFEQLAISELNAFKFASCKTSADANNDTKSLNRSLDRKLTLVVNQKMGEKFHWQLPCVLWKDGETLRQTAERALQELNKTEFHFYGNAPVGFMKYKFPKPVRAKLDAVGMKVFYYKADLGQSKAVNLTINNSDTVQDYRWLRYDELRKVLYKVEYNAVSKFHIE